MIVVLKDSLTGNIVGIISLIIGIISLIITVKTMRSARRIERDIKEAEVKAIDKDRFNKYKESCIKKLELKRKVVADEGVVTYSLCNDVLANLNDLRGYDRVISKKYMDSIN